MAKSRGGRLSGKAAKRNSPWRKRKVQVVGALVLSAAVGVGVTVVALNDSSSVTQDSRKRSPGDKWLELVQADVTPASQSALDYLKVVYQWIDGKSPATEVSTSADIAFDRFMEARSLLADRAPFEPAPRALADLRDSFEVYTDTARLAKLGATISSPDLRTQIQRQILRLRQVADRYYDLAKDELKPHTFQDATLGAEFEFRRNAEVPSFVGTELDAGPPLARPGPVTAVKREYQEVRTVQDAEAWVASVQQLRIPGGESQAAAITEGNVAALGELAVRLTRTSDTLHDAADPRDNRNLNTRIQLGLLVQAEAMRAAQIAALATKSERPAALAIAQTLAIAGNRAWDPQLGVRTTGLSETLLDRKPG